MKPDNSNREPSFENEIMGLEAEVHRVIALTATSDVSRADLIGRLRRLKQKAGILAE